MLADTVGSVQWASRARLLSRDVAVILMGFPPRAISSMNPR